MARGLSKRKVARLRRFVSFSRYKGYRYADMIDKADSALWDYFAFGEIEDFKAYLHYLKRADYYASRINPTGITPPKYNVGQIVWVSGQNIKTKKFVPVKCYVQQIFLSQYCKSGRWQVEYLLQQFYQPECCIGWHGVETSKDEPIPLNIHKFMEEYVFPSEHAYNKWLENELNTPF